MIKHTLIGVLVLLVFSPPVCCGFGWKELTNSELKKWADAIDKELDQITKDVPPSHRKGYYWYMYGAMKSSAYCVRERIILVAQEHLENASLACKGVYSENQAAACRTKIRRLKTISPSK